MELLVILVVIKIYARIDILSKKSSLARPMVIKVGKLVTYGDVKASKKSNGTQTTWSHELT